MKKIALTLIALILFGGIIFISACDKSDLNKPVITLVGDEIITLDLGATWTDPGCTAIDTEDGTITTGFTITGTVNTAQVNTYTITYTVTDKAGNVSDEVTRTVKVKSDLLIGTYNVHDVVTGVGAGTYDYTVTITQSSTDYNKLLINNFGGFGTAVTVNANVLAAVITIPSQHPAGMPSGGEGTFTGTTGAYTVTPSLKSVTSINYSVAYDAGGTDNGSATYTKQ